jgi:hypothetical protein
VLSQALIQDLFEGEERDRLRILMVTATGVFISVSPLAGTFQQATLGWQGSFVVFIALAGIVLLKACFFSKTLGLRQPGRYRISSSPTAGSCAMSTFCPTG